MSIDDNGQFDDFTERIIDRLNFVLKVVDSENDEVILLIEAASPESLQEQFHKIDPAINKYVNERYQELPDHCDEEES